MSSILKNKFFVYFAGLAFFFVAFRYYGYFEDAGRYLLQVVHMLHPERFVNDVPFMFGNQDEFTIFSPLIVLFFKMLGVNNGGIVALLVIEFLWGVAAITLFIQWFKFFNRPAWALPAFFACVVTLTGKIYGSGAYFPILDHILVARFFAEVFILFGLAFFWTRNKYISLIFFFVASLFHPLMGGWGIPLWLFYHYPRTRWLLAAFVVLFPLTCFLHIGRLDCFSDGWLGSMVPFTPKGNDALLYSAILIFWWIAWKFTKSISVSKFAFAMFGICLVGIFWQYAGVALRHQLLVQAQPYRVLWWSFIPMFPVSIVCLREWFDCESVITAGINKFRKKNRIVFAFGLLFLISSAILSNIVQMGLEQNVGNVNLALVLQNVPAKLFFAHKILFCLFLLVCLAERRFWIASILGLSLFNDYLTLLPMFGIVFYLIPNMNLQAKRILIAFLVPYSLVEFLSSLQASPLLDSPLESSVLFVTVFALGLWMFLLRPSTSVHYFVIPLALLVSVIALYDICHWDVRDERRILDERQMDAFFVETIFPQIKDRGRILFVENGESPLQSRFKFLTGTYADETINIGEIFFSGQYIEAMHRKNALLLGDTILGDWGDYSERIAKVYANPDTLFARVNNLCEYHEITHFVTDYANMPLLKVDSVFLEVKQKYMWLYECAF